MARQLRREDYTVGWVCALPIELAAALEMLDEEHPDLKPDPADNDENLYALGSIGVHNVAIVCLPAGCIGNNPAATVATQMRATFKKIRFGLMVGVGGGVPSAEADVRLGDVVVSQPYSTFAGVVQYDTGKATPSGFDRIGALNSPPQMLLAALSKVKANELRGQSKLYEHITKLEGNNRFQRNKAGPDILFEATYEREHEVGQTCDKCDPDRQVARQARDSRKEVVVHYGTIASGNQVIRSAVVRDELSAELSGVLCFEMEAAGLMNSFPCLVVRGICDYADSHKNKQWQARAAGTAAAYAKGLLAVIPPSDVAQTHTMDEAIRKPVGLQPAIKGPVPTVSCRGCDRKFHTQSAADAHMTSTGHGTPTVSCRGCNRKFHTQSAADGHMIATSHGTPTVSCKGCVRRFHTQSAADGHMTATGHGIPTVSCRGCTKKFHTQSAADGHMTATGHGTPTIPCRRCPKKFYTRNAANEHMTAVKH